MVLAGSWTTWKNSVDPSKRDTADGRNEIKQQFDVHQVKMAADFEGFVKKLGTSDVIAGSLGDILAKQSKLELKEMEEWLDEKKMSV